MKKFTHAMYGVSVGPAMALAKSFDFSRHRNMMDVGGGSGVYCIEVVKGNPNISCTVLDLEAVCQVAQEYISKAGLGHKIKTKALDFWKEPLPSGYDAAFLSHILHDYSEERGTFPLKKIFDSLTDDGLVLISEWLINDDKTGPAPSALMGLNMIVETNGGRNYSFDEVSEMLKAAGFKRTEKRTLAAPAQLVIGYKQ
jgi:cyclopropane fatty-acyl-phospholipid synthase-like methyltransferase